MKGNNKLNPKPAFKKNKRKAEKEETKEETKKSFNEDNEAKFKSLIEKYPEIKEYPEIVEEQVKN